MDTTTPSSTARAGSGSARASVRLSLVTATLILVGVACSSSTTAATDGPSSTPTVTEDPSASVAASVTSTPPTSVVDTVDTIHSTTTTTAVDDSTTTSVVDTTTTTAVPKIVHPDDLDGAAANRIPNLGVVTSEGDDLNVRTAPGVGNPVIDRLSHLTTGLVATHEFTLESGTIWRFLEAGDVDLGWVHGGYLDSMTSTAFCKAGPDFPEFEGAVSVADGDVDGDGKLDQVFILADPISSGGHNAWALVSFGNGGVATGQWTGFFEAGIAGGLELVDLDSGPADDDMLELAFLTSSGPAISSWGVMRLEGCSLVTTTLDALPFQFTNGASIGTVTSGGCAYGTGGRIEFTVTTAYPQLAEWETVVYELKGSTWTELDRFDHMDFPELEDPGFLSLDDCNGLVISS